MQTAIRRTFAATLIAFAAVLGGCGDPTPTEATAAGAMFNTGVTFGSGSRGASEDTTATMTSTSESAESGVDNTTATDSGSVARGGVTFGSGS